MRQQQDGKLVISASNLGQQTAHQHDAPDRMPLPVYAWLAAASLLLAVGARLLYGQGGLVPGVAMFAACAAFFAIAARLVGAVRAALLLLIVGGGITRYTVEVLGLSMKVEHVAVLIGGALVVYRVLRRQSRVRIDLPAVMVGGWLGLNAVAAVLHAPNRIGSLRLVAMLALAIAAYFLATHLVTNRTTLAFALVAILATGGGVAAWGILAHLLYPFAIDLGVQINPITRQPTVYGTQWEGNTFGGYCAAIAATMLALRLVGSPFSVRSRRLLEGGLLLALLGLQVSLARGAWLAALAGLVLVAVAAVVLAARQPGSLSIVPARWVAFVPLLVIMSVLLWLNPLVPAARFADSLLARLDRPAMVAPARTGPGAAPGGSATPSPAAGSATLGTRAQSVGDVNDPTYSQRGQAIKRAFDDARTYPLIGWGTGTFGQKYINTSHLPDWLPTVSVRVVHDTGVIGAVLFHALLVLVGWRAIRALWHPLDPGMPAFVFASLTGLVVLTLAYEITEGLQFTFFWLLLGLVTAAKRLATSDAEISIRRTHNG